RRRSLDVQRLVPEGWHTSADRADGMTQAQTTDDIQFVAAIATYRFLMDKLSPSHAPFPVVATLLGLTFVTGLIDGVSFLGLGHVFTANMTGNVVFVGFALGGAAD